MDEDADKDVLSKPKNLVGLDCCTTCSRRHGGHMVASARTVSWKTNVMTGALIETRSNLIPSWVRMGPC